MLGVTLFVLPCVATAQDIKSERQATVVSVLTDYDIDAVNGIRGSCVTGRQPTSIINRRAAGLTELPDAAEYCVAALTRLGRDGNLGYVRDPLHSGLTSALAFDNGFVNAYLKHEAIPVGLPLMVSLKPLAQRCLALSEKDTDLCAAAGYAYGVRAAQGEVVQVP